MDGKKISFGFSKVTKKPALQLNKTAIKHDAESAKIELIKCLEGQQIQLVEERKEAPPLVIPLKDGGKTSAALASLAKRRAVLLGEEDEQNAEKESEKISTNGAKIEEMQDLNKRAEKEILADLQAKTETEDTTNLVLPIALHADELPLDGAKESNIDDYETVPIEKYGWAMLRGMGATEPTKIEQKLAIDSGPVQRPPGLGLGADKALKPKPLLEAPEANEKLEIKKQAFVRILAGKHKDAYGQIEGFDHERGTIIVKMAIGGLKQKFQEFLCQPVSKKEYAQYSKCINKAKYEEYKNQENEHGQIIAKKDKEEHVKIKAEQEKLKFEKMSKLKNLNDFDKRLKNDDIATGSSSQSRTTTDSNRYSRRRSRSRSSSRSKKYNSTKRHYDSSSDDSRRFKHTKKHADSFSDDDDDEHRKASSRISATDSSNDERRKPKSYRSKSSSHKKKHKRHYSSGNSSSGNNSDSSYASDDTDKARSKRHKRDKKKKKSKKKTKKSKRERSRSRTPTRRRR